VQLEPSLHRVAVKE